MTPVGAPVGAGRLRLRHFDLNGTWRRHNCCVDTASLTGESEPIGKGKGDTVVAGSVVGTLIRVGVGAGVSAGAGLGVGLIGNRRWR